MPYYAPKHHPRATRLLNGVLTLQPSNFDARFARAQIFQVANKWAEARKHFQILLDQTQSAESETDEKNNVNAKEELAWCLVNEGKLDEGRELLESVVEVRSGNDRFDAKDEQALARARAWWRLGRTEWMIGGM